MPVLAGRVRRRIVGYFTGHIPLGLHTGREVRLVKLPELNWVYGYLMRAKEIGPVLYVRSAAMLQGVEGFHPMRSDSTIRQFKKAQGAHNAATPRHSVRRSQTNKPVTTA